MPTLTERLYSATAQIEADIGSFRSGISTASGVSGFLSAALTQSGISLMARDTGISGALTTRVADTGSAAVAYAASLFSTASTNLTNSGVTLFSRDSAISGAIDTRLTQSGISLIARDTGISGALSSQIATTGQAAVAYASGISGALQTTLDLKAPLTSPALTGTPTAPTATIGTNTTQLATTEFVQGVVNLVKPGAETRGGIVSAGTSAVGTTQDNPGLAFGTSDLTIGAWVRWPDFTPSSAKYIIRKSVIGGSLGLAFGVNTDGTLRLEIGNGTNATSYASTVATGLTDGAWALIAAVLDRDSSVTFSVNAVQLGNTVSIAAQAAQTLTSTAEMTWGASGTNYTAGTLGESWIINGLLSASRIADIYRAGSIAPFCVMTPNTTTGQNTATIDGLSFFQWLECDQGYGPIIRDRSGNNQHALMGTSGLFHAVRKNPPGLPQRAPRTALVGDGSNGSFVRATLATQSPLTGDFSLLWDGIVPNDTTATTRPFAGLTSNTTEIAQGSTFHTGFISGNFVARLYGATSNDFRVLTGTGMVAMFAGKRAQVIATRSGIVLKVFIAVDGDLFDATNLFTETTSGTPPAWSGSVSGDYLVGIYLNATNSSAHSLYDLRLANVAMTEAQLRTEYERGEPGPEWSGASNTPLYASDFSAGANSWASSAGTPTVDGNIDGIAGEDNTLRITVSSTGTTQITRDMTGIVKRKAYRARWRQYHTGNTTAAALRLGGINASTLSAPGGTAVARQTSAAGTWETKTVDFISQTGTAADLQYRLAIEAANGGNPTAGDVIYVKDFTLTPVGWTTRLRTDTAAGGTAINEAKSATNDASDFLYTPTSVKAQPQNFRQRIRASTSTNGNQQLFGAACIDTTKKWRIRSWTIYCASGTPTTSLGDVSGGAQYVSSYVLAAGLNDVTPIITRLPATANLWCASDSTAQLDHVVILDLVE
jgi:hypothetical protein